MRSQNRIFAAVRRRPKNTNSAPERACRPSCSVNGTTSTLRAWIDRVTGVLVTDRGTQFGFWAMKRRQICWAHLIRKFASFGELRGRPGAIGRDLLLWSRVLLHSYLHLEPRFGAMSLDEITVGEIARLRADLVDQKLGEKRINNILAVLSKALKYAVDCEVLVKAPKIGLFKVERPEIVAWDFEQYARLLAAAKVEDEEWYAGTCLAGEAGLRVGAVKALRWREDVDMIARTITVNRQTYRGQTGTPKGRTRRTVPMTTTLHDALKRMSTIREGLVVRNLDGTAKTDDQAVCAIQRICRREPSGRTQRCSA